MGNRSTAIVCFLLGAFTIVAIQLLSANFSLRTANPKTGFKFDPIMGGLGGYMITLTDNEVGTAYLYQMSFERERNSAQLVATIDLGKPGSENLPVTLHREALEQLTGNAKNREPRDMPGLSQSESQTPKGQGFSPPTETAIPNQLDGPKIGETFHLGNLEVVVRDVEFGSLDRVNLNLLSRKTITALGAIVTVEVKNISEGLVLTPKMRVSVEDNFGNECRQENGSPQKMEGDMQGRKLLPGESATLKTYFDTVIPSAKSFKLVFTVWETEKWDSKGWTMSVTPTPK